MNILLANHHLADRAGSELFTFELATSLRGEGHEVGVFTFIPGAISGELASQGVRVFTPADRAAIEAFEPDLLHCHHSPCLYFLAGLNLSCPVVHGMLGPQISFEQAPAVFRGVALGLAVSEEVREQAARSPFGRQVDVRIFRNWFDDRTVERRTVHRVHDVRRVAVISNHLAPGVKLGLDTIAQRHSNFTWQHFGAPTNSIAVDPALLEQFDAVVSIGRTALLCGAMGKPCLLYDVHGSDGWLEASRLPQLASRNFSGRVSGRPLDAAELEATLFEEVGKVDLQATSDACWADFPLSVRKHELAYLYALALRRGPKLDAQARQAYGQLGQLFSDLVHMSAEHLRQHEAELKRHIDSLETENAAVVQQLAEMTRDLSVLKGSAGVRLIEQVKRVPGLYSAYLRLKKTAPH